MPHEIDRVLAAVQSRTWLIDEEKAAEVVALLAVRMHPLHARRPAVAGPNVLPAALPQA